MVKKPSPKKKKKKTQYVFRRLSWERFIDLLTVSARILSIAVDLFR
jgi:hypothetical protein